MTPRLRLLRILRRWHARIGIAAALFFLALAATGVALNHVAEFGLNTHRVHSGWLARLLRPGTQSAAAAFEAGSHLIVAGGGNLLFDGKRISEDAPAPLGVVALPEGIYVAMAGSLSEYSSEGQLIEKISTELLPPAPLLALGRADNRLALKTASGIFAASSDLQWKSDAGKDVAWSAPRPLSELEHVRLDERLVPGISLATVLVEIHSGRILGRHGPLFMDAVAVALAALSVMGAFVFLRSHRKH